jgi:hypothetical protein
MTGVTEVRDAPATPADLGAGTGLLAAIVLGGGLALCARATGPALLVAVAVVQAVLAICWVYGTALPSSRGALVVAALAAAGSDVAVSRFPHGRLGALLIVLGLAVPVLFAHQLFRGAARRRVIRSMSGLALLVLAEVSVAALVQTRHEFATALGPAGVGATVAAAAVAAPASALIVGYLADMLIAAPRFDRQVPRGVPALVASVAVGAAVGYLILRSVPGFGAGGGAVLGAALGVLAGLLAVAAAFAQYTSAVGGRWRRPQRAVASAALPLCLLAPVGFLLCLAIHT